MTCVILASKFHERDDNVPLIQEMMHVLLPDSKQASIIKKVSRPQPQHQQITYRQVCQNELDLMSRLDWNLHRVTI